MNNDENSIVGFITVRTNSTRLPKKSLLSFGDSTVLNHIIRRVVSYNIDKSLINTKSSSNNI